MPITLQTFGVMLAGCVLGPLRGFLAVSLYLALGAIGLPVFAEHSSGLAVFTSVSAGYLWSFPLAAAGRRLPGEVRRRAERGKTRALVVFLCSITAQHPRDPPDGHRRADALPRHLAVATRFNIDTVFWIGDILKTTLVALIAAEVHRAFPRLLPHSSLRVVPTLELEAASVTVRARGADRILLEPTTLTLTERRIGVIGANGSGKSTLVRLLNGLVEPDVRPGARRRARRRPRGRARTPARRVLLHRPGRPAGDADLRRGRRAVAAAQREGTARSGGDPARSRCSSASASAEHADDSVHSLSGGQQQLLALAGVLAVEPARPGRRRADHAARPRQHPPGRATCCSTWSSSWCWSPTTSTWRAAATGCSSSRTPGSASTGPPTRRSTTTWRR